jgi:hypothetical protein
MRLPRGRLPTLESVIAFLGTIAHAYDLGRIRDWRRHLGNFRLARVDGILDDGQLGLAWPVRLAMIRRFQHGNRLLPRR